MCIEWNVNQFSKTCEERPWSTISEQSKPNLATSMKAEWRLGACLGPLMTADRPTYKTAGFRLSSRNDTVNIKVVFIHLSIFYFLEKLKSRRHRDLDTAHITQNPNIIWLCRSLASNVKSRQSGPPLNAPNGLHADLRRKREAPLKIRHHLVTSVWHPSVACIVIYSYQRLQLA